MKREGKHLLLVSLLWVLIPGAAWADLSFEQGLSDWTIEHRQDSFPGTTHQFTEEVVENRASRGERCIRLGAQVVDNDEEMGWDFTQTIVWKEDYDLSSVRAIWLDMTDISHADPASFWGYGMEAALVVSDGVHESYALLWAYHEEPYFDPGIEDNRYESIVTGADGTSWYRYRVPLDDPSRWGTTDLGGGPLSAVNLSNAKIGIYYAASSWYRYPPQTLFCQGLVDNVHFESAIPILNGRGMIILSSSLLGAALWLIKRRRSSSA
jgi:hypothetical protein